MADFLGKEMNGDLEGLSADICKEVEIMADSMRGVFKDWDKQYDVLFFRVFHTNETASNSIRKDLNQILEFG